jgi:hypothetical protein
MVVKAPCIINFSSFTYDSCSGKNYLGEKTKMEEHFATSLEIYFGNGKYKKLENHMYLKMTAFFQQHVWA